jgi:hypothetical protein
VLQPIQGLIEASDPLLSLIRSLAQYVFPEATRLPRRHVLGGARQRDSHSELPSMEGRDGSLDLLNCGFLFGGMVDSMNGRLSIMSSSSVAPAVALGRLCRIGEGNEYQLSL